MGIGQNLTIGIDNESRSGTRSTRQGGADGSEPKNRRSGSSNPPGA